MDVVTVISDRHVKHRFVSLLPDCSQPDEEPVPEAPEVADDLDSTMDLEPTVEPADPELSTSPVTQPISLDQPVYAHGENYEWLMGVVHRVHIPRKGWKIRYAPLDQQDQWGGSVVPAPDVRIDGFQDGDNIYVEGEIISDRASLYLSGPRYRITSIRRVDEDDLRRVARLP